MLNVQYHSKWLPLTYISFWIVRYIHLPKHLGTRFRKESAAAAHLISCVWYAPSKSPTPIMMRKQNENKSREGQTETLLVLFGLFHIEWRVKHTPKISKFFEFHTWTIKWTSFLPDYHQLFIKTYLNYQLFPLCIWTIVIFQVGKGNIE